MSGSGNLRLGIITMNATLHDDAGGASVPLREMVVDARTAAAMVGGGDVHFAGGIALLRAEKLGLGNTFTIRLRAPDREQRENGERIVREVRGACRNGDHSRLRRLVAWFGPLVLRVRQLHAHLDAVEPRVAAGILGSAAMAGRPPEPTRAMAVAATIDRLMEVYGITATEAARRLARARDARRYQNIHSAHRADARARARGVYFPGSELADAQWALRGTSTELRFYDGGLAKR
jgi:hypothetical protein